MVHSVFNTHGCSLSLVFAFCMSFIFLFCTGYSEASMYHIKGKNLSVIYYTHIQSDSFTVASRISYGSYTPGMTVGSRDLSGLSTRVGDTVSVWTAASELFCICQRPFGRFNMYNHRTRQWEKSFWLVAQVNRPACNKRHENREAKPPEPVAVVLIITHI